jgi:hypothetical protein
VGIVSGPGALPFSSLMYPEITNSAKRPSETLLHPKMKVGGDLSTLGAMDMK